MSKNFNFFIPCNKANQVCDKAQYQEATLWTRTKLIIHLIYCRLCRKYTLNNIKLTKKIKESKIKCLDKKTKESMRKDLEKAIKEYSN